MEGLIGPQCFSMFLPKSGVFHISRNRTNHELLAGLPSRIRCRTSGLEPVFALAVFIIHRYSRVVLNNYVQY